MQCKNSGVRTIVMSWAIVLALTLVGIEPAQAQQFKVLYMFTGLADGANPLAGVTVGGPGIFYGTAANGGTGGSGGNGVVFKLTQHGSNWVFSPLYEFAGGQSDGHYPRAGVVIGPDGALYGTTFDGGGSGAGNGTVFRLRPPATSCRSMTCYWNETIIHAFTGAPGDGAGPGYGSLTFDRVGNIYGTTYSGGANYAGAVYEIAPSGGGWTESVIYSFDSQLGSDGWNPLSGVVFDTAGNLYGNNTVAGTCEMGVIYQLMPVGSGWTEHTLANICPDLGDPFSTLIIDQSGNLYGTMQLYGGGAVYEVSQTGDQWSLTPLYLFTGGPTCNPYAGVTFGPNGNLYGVCSDGGMYGYGWVFELTLSGGITDLHDFDNTDGSNAYGTPTFDSNGNLYGTSFGGGNSSGACAAVGCGTVWEIEGVGSRH